MTKATIIRQQESELPASLTMDFINLNADHQQGSQTARRLSVQSEQKVQIASPIVFTDELAKNIAEQLLYNVWIERNRFTLVLPRAYSYLGPTDVFMLADSEAGIQYTIRIVKATLARNGAMALECVAEFAPAYAQNAVTGVAQVVSQTPLTSSSTNIIVMDLPALRDSDNSLGYYIAMSGTTEVWGGGAVYTSVDGGASYTLLDSTATPSITGTASRLYDWDGGNTIDEKNSVVLDPLVGGLSSIDMTALLNGGNLLALQSGDGWELLQFRRAVLQLDGTYMVSGLLRGRFGTEWAMGGHVSGDKFVLMDTNTVRRVPITSAQLGIPILMKALGLGQPLGSVDPISVTNRGVALKPYSPVILGGGREADGATILNWVRRTRIGGAWLDYADTPLSEASELYDVEIYDESYTTVIREFRVSIPALTYTAAQQVEDFGSTQEVVYFKVFQISATVGRGYEAKGSI